MDYSGDNKYLKTYHKKRNRYIITGIIFIILVIAIYCTYYFYNANQYVKYTQQSYCKTHKVSHIAATQLSDKKTALVLCDSKENNSTIIEVFKSVDNPLNQNDKNANNRVKYEKHITYSGIGNGNYEYIFPSKDGGFFMVGGASNTSDTNGVVFAKYDKNLNYVETDIFQGINLNEKVNKELLLNFMTKLNDKELNKMIVKNDIPKPFTLEQIKLIKNKYSVDINIVTLKENYQKNNFEKFGYRNNAVLVLANTQNKEVFTVYLKNPNQKYRSIFEKIPMKQYPETTCTVRYHKDKEEFNNTRDAIATHYLPYMIIPRILVYAVIAFALFLIVFFVGISYKISYDRKKDRKTAEELIKKYDN